MKKVIALVLSMFVLVLSAHPAVMFHFCSGSLASVTISKDNTHSRCCTLEIRHDKTSFLLTTKHCCQDYAFELSTQEYTSRSEISQVQVQEFYYPACLRSHSLDLESVSNRTLLSEFYYPRYIRYEAGRDVLCRFCVYII